RKKYRYLTCELVAENRQAAAQAGEGELIAAVRESVLTLHGALGLGRVVNRLKLVDWSRDTGVLVLRVSRDTHRYLASALPFVKSLHGSRVAIATLHCSGTVRCAAKFLTRFYSADSTVRKQKILASSLAKLGAKPI
ncbi:hypothetical protein BOX15_Mlig024472g3, partial [Macrostomum lignano]